MPELQIDGIGTVMVAEGKRLVKAIAASGSEIGHRCGGNARCTTCRVTFIAGEPETMTRAEYDKLKEKELLGQARLSCQIVCDHDMSVKPLMLRSDMGWEDSGPEPEDDVMPEARWLLRSDLEKQA